MRLVWLAYGLGVIAGSLVGFLSPLWYLGFIPVSAGLIWAAYDLVEVPRAESSTASERRS